MSENLPRMLFLSYRRSDKDEASRMLLSRLIGEHGRIFWDEAAPRDARLLRWQLYFAGLCTGSYSTHSAASRRDESEPEPSNGGGLPGGALETLGNLALQYSDASAVLGPSNHERPTRKALTKILPDADIFFIFSRSKLSISTIRSNGTLDSSSRWLLSEPARILRSYDAASSSPRILHHLSSMHRGISIEHILPPRHGAGRPIARVATCDSSRIPAFDARRPRHRSIVEYHMNANGSAAPAYFTPQNVCWLSSTDKRPPLAESPRSKDRRTAILLALHSLLAATASTDLDRGRQLVPMLVAPDIDKVFPRTTNARDGHQFFMQMQPDPLSYSSSESAGFTRPRGPYAPICLGCAQAVDLIIDCTADCEALAPDPRSAVIESEYFPSVLHLAPRHGAAVPELAQAIEVTDEFIRDKLTRKSSSTRAVWPGADAAVAISSPDYDMYSKALENTLEEVRGPLTSRRAADTCPAPPPTTRTMDGDATTDSCGTIAALDTRQEIAMAMRSGNGVRRLRTGTRRQTLASSIQTCEIIMFPGVSDLDKSRPGQVEPNGQDHESGAACRDEPEEEAASLLEGLSLDNFGRNVDRLLADDRRRSPPTPPKNGAVEK